jgi:hypothetical protein
VEHQRTGATPSGRAGAADGGRHHGPDRIGESLDGPDPAATDHDGDGCPADPERVGDIRLAQPGKEDEAGHRSLPVGEVVEQFDKERGDALEETIRASDARADDQVIAPGPAEIDRFVSLRRQLAGTSRDLAATRRERTLGNPPADPDRPVADTSDKDGSERVGAWGEETGDPVDVELERGEETGRKGAVQAGAEDTQPRRRHRSPVEANDVGADHGDRTALPHGATVSCLRLAVNG